MNFLDFDIWSFLLIIGIGPGITLFLVLMLKKDMQLSHTLLAGWLVILTLDLAQFLLLSSKYYVSVPHLVHITGPFLFLMGPLFYFFVQAQLKPALKFRDIGWLHILPFLLALIYFMPWFLQPSGYKLQVLTEGLKGTNLGITLKGFLHPFIHISQTLTYTVLAYKALRRFSKNSEARTKDMGKKVTQLLLFSKAFAIYWVLQLLGLVAITLVQYYVYQIDYVLAMINSCFIQLLCFQFLLRPDFLSYLSSNRKYQGSALSAKTYNSILERVEELTAKQIYLDSELTLQKFSEILKVNKNYISQVVNQEFGCGFSDFINGFRVQKAKELLLDSQYGNMKVLGIALEAGFNSKASFIRVFKSKTGKTPVEYKKSKLTI